MDRVNVGGSQSGQQAGYISRGASTGNNKWSIDGVDITDMSATGASPIYYDFDMLQEMQVTTGGADASQRPAASASTWSHATALTSFAVRAAST